MARPSRTGSLRPTEADLSCGAGHRAERRTRPCSASVHNARNSPGLGQKRDVLPFEAVPAPRAAPGGAQGSSLQADASGPGPEATPAQPGGPGSPSLPTCTISVKETVPLAVVTEKGGVRTGGSPSAVCPVRTKGWYPVTSKE